MQHGVNVFFERTLEIKDPTRATDKSAGYDLFLPESIVFLPRCKKIEVNDILKAEEIDPNKYNVVWQMGQFRTGLKLCMPEGYYAVIESRSSAFKKGIIAQGVIDEDYRGEIYISAMNMSDKVIVFEKDTSFAQIIFHKQTDNSKQKSDLEQFINNNQEIIEHLAKNKDMVQYLSQTDNFKLWNEQRKDLDCLRYLSEQNSEDQIKNDDIPTIQSIIEKCREKSGLCLTEFGNLSNKLEIIIKHNKDRRNPIRKADDILLPSGTSRMYGNIEYLLFDLCALEELLKTLTDDLNI